MNYVNGSKQLDKFPLISHCFLSLSDSGERTFFLGLSFPTYKVMELDQWAGRFLFRYSKIVCLQF